MYDLTKTPLLNNKIGMAILKINAANPGVKRPLKVEDLANIWEGLDNALALGVTDTPRIICGFGTDSNDYLTPGVIAYMGKLYVYDATTPITVDAFLYGAEVSTGDNRVMGDGTTQLFSYARKVVTQSTGNVLIGEATYANLDLWKTAYLAEKSVLSGMLADGAVTPIKLANNAVSTPKLQDYSVTGAKIASGAVDNQKIAQNTILQENIGYGGPDTKALQEVTYADLTTEVFNFETVYHVKFDPTGGVPACITVAPDRDTVPHYYKSYFTNIGTGTGTEEINFQLLVTSPNTVVVQYKVPVGQTICIDLYVPEAESNKKAMVSLTLVDQFKFI